MRNSRRKFLTRLSVVLFAPHLLSAEGTRRERSRWDYLFNTHEPSEPSLRPEPATWRDDTITASWIGHSTVLLNFYGTWIITDPVFSERVGINLLGLSTIGPKRLVYPALDFEQLPPIDLVLLSHGHMDHCDLPTLESFRSDIPFVMAKNTTDIIDGLGKSRHKVVELDWGESSEVAGVYVEAIRVKHFGWRFPWESDRSRGVWNGRSFNAYLVTKNGKSFVFGGDTAYHEYFKPVGERGLDIELAIMPIGTYNPWLRNHCNPEQAVEMANHLRANAVLPIHHSTFIMSDEPEDEPARRFKAALAESPRRVALSEVGDTWTPSKYLTSAS